MNKQQPPQDSAAVLMDRRLENMEQEIWQLQQALLELADAAVDAPVFHAVHEAAIEGDEDPPLVPGCHDTCTRMLRLQAATSKARSLLDGRIIAQQPDMRPR